MNSKVLVGLVVLLVGVGAGWYFFQGKPAQETMTKTEGTPALEEPAVPGLGVEETVVVTPPATGGESMEKGGVTGSGQTAAATVQYTDSGFVPATVTVKKGTTVTFKNTSSRGMRVASAVHPTHQLLPGFDQLKSVEKGGMYEYTFTKVGTWKYHNHVGLSDTGTVVVTE